MTDSSKIHIHADTEELPGGKIRITCSACEQEVATDVIASLHVAAPLFGLHMTEVHHTDRCPVCGPPKINPS